MGTAKDAPGEVEVPVNVDNPAAVSAVVRRKGKYLLVLRKNPPAQNMYAFPGGRLEAGETSAGAAIRELAEETGLLASAARPYATYDLNATGRVDVSAYHLTVFIVDEPGDREPQPLDDAAALGWFTYDETKKLPMPPSMHHCLAKLAANRPEG